MIYTTKNTKNTKVVDNPAFWVQYLGRLLEEAIMSLRWIGDETLLNENAVAWISFSHEDGALRAAVHFLVRHPQRGELVTEVFAGAAAEGLRRLCRKPETSAVEPAEGSGSAANVFDVEPLRKKKGWFFSRSGNRPAVLAFVNAKGSCSVRSYDVQTGIFLGKTYRHGDYQDSFSDLVRGATEVTINSQPNLERDCKERLPDRVLSYLKNQISETEMQQNG
jgi:hypothetical protein